MNNEFRGFIVWFMGTFIVLGAFMAFVFVGFPGAPDVCVDETPNNGCFCEEFKKADILANKRGVRQPSNTWFNLYAIGTSFLVAFFVFLDRREPSVNNAPNLMKSYSWIPDAYIFAVLFLGLGSMWFHASLIGWAGIFDGLSMYIYASFLVFYSIRRFWSSNLFFWLAYLGTVVLFTILHAAGVPSVINIMVLVAAYLVFEVIIWIRTGKAMQGRQLTTLLWLLAVNSILAATLFWSLSKTGGCMCDPTSGFQPHGMLWHPLAGVMAVLLYFYWREADDRAALGTRI